MRPALARNVTPIARLTIARTHLPPRLRADIRRKLLRWYDRHRRDLPWRHRATDAYAQWVAEAMLQQTRVDTVLPKYERFMVRFPSVRALADADHDEVLKHWEGLGYYRRIHHLHRAARIVRDAGGKMPRSADQFRELPGVGEYMSAAIASIAYGQRVAAVDGNVARVIARLFVVRDDVLSPSGKAAIGEIARALIPVRRPGDFNQAWMDLGTAVCTPKSPDCDSCPLVACCGAAATGQTAVLPVRGKRGPVVEITTITVLFLDADRILVRRRPTGGLWSGLWEFPNTDIARGTAHQGAIANLAREHGLQLLDGTHDVGTVTHRLTHRAIRFRVYAAWAVSGSAPRMDSRSEWVSADGFDRLAVSTAHRRIMRKASPVIDRLRRGGVPRNEGVTG